MKTIAALQIIMALMQMHVGPEYHLTMLAKGQNIIGLCEQVVTKGTGNLTVKVQDYSILYVGENNRCCIWQPFNEDYYFGVAEGGDGWEINGNWTSWIAGKAGVQQFPKCVRGEP